MKNSEFLHNYLLNFHQKILLDTQGTMDSLVANILGNQKSSSGGGCFAFSSF